MWMNLLVPFHKKKKKKNLQFSFKYLETDEIDLIEKIINNKKINNK